MRKLRPLKGEGRNTKPRLIKGGLFCGKILKGINGALTERQAKTAKRACEHYQKTLIEAGIPIIPAEVKIVGHRNSRKIYFIQQMLQPEKILSRYFANASRRECMRIIDSMLAYEKRIIEFNRTHRARLSMDANFHNWVMVNSVPTLIDFFPPRAQGKKGFDRVGLYTAKSKIFKAGHVVLWPIAQRRKYDPKKALRVILYDAIHLRPELAEEILKAGRSFARENFSGRELSKLLRNLSSAKTLKKASFLGRTATSIEDRKRKKLEKKAK